VVVVAVGPLSCQLLEALVQEQEALAALPSGLDNECLNCNMFHCKQGFLPHPTSLSFCSIPNHSLGCILRIPEMGSA